ncbi:MAG: hypothetical protein H6702_22795 [Myxococcales bacterium]|nr:hypothetical protein [Myxococcales bacterium]
MSRAFVVDASVLRAASPLKAQGAGCHAALQAMTDMGAAVVLGHALKPEADKHANRISARWLRTQISKKLFVKAQPAPELVEAVLQACDAHLPPARHPAVRKDVQMVEAAHTTDQRVLSLDDRMAADLRPLVAHVPALAPIHWVNPARHAAADWIGHGAPDHPPWTLAHAPD